MSRSGSLCSGYGGLDIAVEQVLGAKPAWYSDIEPAAQRVFEHHWPGVPNLGDIKRIRWDTVEPVDVLTAGYPCQPFSNAGKRKGVEDDRHIWPYIAKGIRTLRPGLIVLENVPGHRSRGFDCVLGDLAEVGYRVAWGSVRASDVGAAHKRERVFIVAADAASEPRFERWTSASGEAQGGQPLGEPGGRGVPPPDADSSGLAFGEVEPDGDEFSSAERGCDDGVDWREYAGAVAHWGRRLGRPAPYPVALGPRGGKKVSPAFAEWMMGLPEGHISNVPGVNINQAVKLAGNGVVPQAAAYAIRLLLPVVLDGANAQALRAASL